MSLTDNKSVVGDRKDLSSYLAGRPFIKIPKDMFSIESNDDNDLLLTIYYYVISYENRHGTSRFSIGDILSSILMFERKTNKPKAALGKVISTINELQDRGIIKLMSEVNEKTKFDFMIESIIINRLNPSDNYVELYVEEFHAILSYCRNVFQKYSVNTMLRFYLYVKWRTFNGTSLCIQSADRIGHALGYSKTTATHYLRALHEGNDEYEPLLICFKSHNGVSQTDVTYALNKKFRKKNVE